MNDEPTPDDTEARADDAVRNMFMRLAYIGILVGMTILSGCGLPDNAEVRFRNDTQRTLLIGPCIGECVIRDVRLGALEVAPGTTKLGVAPIKTWTLMMAIDKTTGRVVGCKCVRPVTQATVSLKASRFVTCVGVPTM